MSNVHNGKPFVSVLWLVTFVSDSVRSNVKTNRKVLVRRRALYNRHTIFVFAWNKWGKMARNFRVFRVHTRNRVGHLQTTSMGR